MKYNLKGINGINDANDKCLMDQTEQKALHKFSKARKIVEIGSYRGGSAKIMIQEAIELLCLDPHYDIVWDTLHITGDEIQASFFEQLNPFENWKYLRLPSDAAVEHIKSNYYDLLLVDGDHSYKQCLADLENYVPLLTDNAIILVHDFCLAFTSVIAACVNHFGRMPDELYSTLAVYYKSHN